MHDRLARCERPTKPCATPPHGSVESGPWWAQPVGGSRVHPHQHDANHPLKSDRRLVERTWCGGEKLPETEAARHSHGDQRRVGRPVRACGSGRGRFPQRPRPPVGRNAPLHSSRRHSVCSAAVSPGSRVASSSHEQPSPSRRAKHEIVGEGSGPRRHTEDGGHCQLAGTTGYRFPSAIIGYAVWLYYRFTLSFRDVEDLLAQRGITVSYDRPKPIHAIEMKDLSRSAAARCAESVARRCRFDPIVSAYCL
jgi:hypothetical protein